MICFDAFKFLEANRWDSEQTVNWDKFDGTITDIQARWMKKNCFNEWTTAPGTYAFLRDFGDDPDFCSFMAVWFFEEQKHFLIQYEYLKRFRPDLVPSQEEIEHVNMYFDPTANKYSLLFLHHIEELQVTNWYLNIIKDITEPVARQIFKLMAADESRHSKLFYDYCDKYIKKDYAAAAEGYTKTALFVLRDRKTKHPVGNRVNQGLEDDGHVQARIPDKEVTLMSWSESVANEDPHVLHNKIYNSLSKLLGHEFKSTKDILEFRRKLKTSAS